MGSRSGAATATETWEDKEDKLEDKLGHKLEDKMTNTIHLGKDTEATDLGIHGSRGTLEHHRRLEAKGHCDNRHSSRRNNKCRRRDGARRRMPSAR